MTNLVFKFLIKGKLIFRFSIGHFVASKPVYCRLKIAWLQFSDILNIWHPQNNKNI